MILQYPFQNGDSTSRDYDGSGILDLNDFMTDSDMVTALHGRVRLDIYDLIGQRIRSLVSEYPTAATYEIGWDGKMESGANAASGVYLVKLSVGPKLMTRKLFLLR